MQMVALQGAWSHAWMLAQAQAQARVGVLVEAQVQQQLDTMPPSNRNESELATGCEKPLLH